VVVGCQGTQAGPSVKQAERKGVSIVGSESVSPGGPPEQFEEVPGARNRFRCSEQFLEREMTRKGKG
jgi:hypothetical protein